MLVESWHFIKQWQMEKGELWLTVALSGAGMDGSLLSLSCRTRPSRMLSAQLPCRRPGEHWKQR